MSAGLEYATELDATGAQDRYSTSSTDRPLNPHEHATTCTRIAFTDQWIPTDGDHARRMIAHTGLAGPKETVDVTFTVPPPGEYPFICTYASHWTQMQGRLVVTR